MLQDLPIGRLENEFQVLTPEKDDIVICFQGINALLKRNQDDSLELPRYSQVQAWSVGWNRWSGEPYQYIFRLQGVNFFLWMGESGESGDGSYQYESTSPCDS